MIAHRRGSLSILGLVASDASYYEPRTREPREVLACLTDNTAVESEHWFPDSLWGPDRFRFELS